MALSPLKPRTNRAEEVQTERQPNNTYEIDYTSGTLGGMIDGRKAIRQFARKAVQTARFRFFIYDDDYGSELDELIGKDVSIEFLNEEIPRVIREALIYDDRVKDVNNFNVDRQVDKVFVSFSVETVEGVINEEVTL